MLSFLNCLLLMVFLAPNLRCNGKRFPHHSTVHVWKSWCFLHQGAKISKLLSATWEYSPCALWPSIYLHVCAAGESAPWEWALLVLLRSSAHFFSASRRGGISDFNLQGLKESFTQVASLPLPRLEVFFSPTKCPCLLLVLWLVLHSSSPLGLQSLDEMLARGWGAHRL